MTAPASAPGSPQLGHGVPHVSETLALAFADDPFMRWIFGTQAELVDTLRVWWGWLSSHVPETGEVWHLSPGDEPAAAAIWYPPRETPSADETPEAAAPADATADRGADDVPEINPFVEMLTPLVGERLGEVLEMFARGGEMHPEEPHWYLLALGTRPERQGHGHGARLVRPVLDRCDEQGIGAYLESSNPRNIPFYHRLGFEVVGETLTPDRSAVVTGMWRRAR